MFAFLVEKCYLRYSLPHMNIISLDNISKTLKDEPLFEEVTLGIEEGDKIGFVGLNGSGKSTLLKLILGDLETDSGAVSRNRGLRIAMLDQRPAYTGTQSLRDFFLAGSGGVLDLLREYESRIHKPLGSGTADERFALLTDRMEKEGGFAAENVFASYCAELGLGGPSAVMGTMSGGMARKAALARCLASGADFLLLDEPTNHLDIRTILWLENLLKVGKAGFILVTHDRYFLDAVCSSVLELSRNRLYRYPGNYSSYIERKASRELELEKAMNKREVILRRELVWLKRGPKARTGKDKSRKDRIQNLQDAEVREELSLSELSSAHRRLGKKILELSDITKSFDGREIIAPFTYNFRKGERIGIIGPNGSGKTTFLELIAGRVKPDGGSVRPGINTTFAYLGQTGREISGEQTVLEYMKGYAERISMEDGSVVSVEQFLERFLFPRSMFNQNLSSLSGGEFRRLYLVRLLAGAPNFLLLDEPTNDLDIDTILLLEEYLLGFGGCILLVSHDRAMLERLTDYLFIFDGRGGIQGFVGGYEDYILSLEDDEADYRRAAPEKNRKKEEGAKRGLSFKERQEYETLLEQIDELEKERKLLETFFQKTQQEPEELAKANRRYAETGKLLDGAMKRWEELAERV